MATETNKTLGTIALPLEMVKVNYQFNVRTKHGKKGSESYRGIESLAADIKRDGQLTPVIVRPVGDGTFTLVAGFRRYDAMKTLGLNSIEARIMEMDDLRAAILNAKENTNRDGITTYEFAGRCCQLRDQFKLTQNEVAKEFAAGTDYKGEGMSRSYVGNLMRAYDKLIKPITEAWRDSATGLTTDKLIKWGALTDDEQTAKWEEFTGTGEADGEGEGEGEGKSAKETKKGPRRQTESKLGEALKAVSDAKLSETVKDAATATLNFALGKSKTLRIGGTMVYDPKKTKKTKTSKADGESDTDE